VTTYSTDITLRPRHDGTAVCVVERAGQDTGARIVHGWAGFQTGTGEPDQFQPYGSPWTRVSSVVAWLESDQGQCWLDSLRDDR
jgi:hypothetical protein